MTDVSNLEAWAKTQGYDPEFNYLEGNEPPEVEEPSPEELPPGYLSRNFKESEFACRHCGSVGSGIDPDLVKTLQAIRDHFGVPVTINSGYRCPTHNRNVGGAQNSQHLKGTAVDFVVKGISPAEMFSLLDPVWPGGLGRYNNFTHIDTRSNRARW